MQPEHCVNCEFIKPCRVLINKEWKHFYICDIYTDEAIVVGKNDNCEMFRESEDEE